MYLISCQALATAVRDVHVVSGQDLTVEVAKAKKKQLGITREAGYTYVASEIF